MRNIASAFCLASAAVILLSANPADAEVVHEERSLYARLIVEDNQGLRCLKFTQKRDNSTQTCLNLSNPQELVFTYAKMSLSSLLLTPKPEQILIIGLGGGTLPMALRSILPNADIETVEIDPAVVRVAKAYFGFQEDDKNRVITQDARVYGKRAALGGKKFDLIFLDAFNGEYIPEHLMTVEFLQEMQSLLTEEGVLVANTFVNSRLYDYESATYAAVFGNFLNFRQATTGNRVILVPSARLAPNSRPPLDLNQLRRHASDLAPALKPFDVPIRRYAKRLHGLSIQSPDWDTNTRPLTDQFSPANVLKSQGR